MVDPSNDELSLNDDQIRCLRLFSNFAVRYLVIGGHAVRYHGHVRPTKDLDVLAANDEDNAVRLCNALLKIINWPHPNLKPSQIVSRWRQINISSWGPQFEVLTGAEGVNFDAAFARRCVARVANLAVPILSREDLLAMKRRSGRAEDLQDVTALEAV